MYISSGMESVSGKLLEVILFNVLEIVSKSIRGNFNRRAIEMARKYRNSWKNTAKYPSQSPNIFEWYFKLNQITKHSISLRTGVRA